MIRERKIQFKSMLSNIKLLIDVTDGYAKVSTYPPNVRYQRMFLGLQKEARENHKGLWRGGEIQDIS